MFKTCWLLPSHFTFQFHSMSMMGCLLLIFQSLIMYRLKLFLSLVAFWSTLSKPQLCCPESDLDCHLWRGGLWPFCLQPIGKLHNYEACCAFNFDSIWVNFDMTIHGNLHLIWSLSKCCAFNFQRLMYWQIVCIQLSDAQQPSVPPSSKSA